MSGRLAYASRVQPMTMILVRRAEPELPILGMPDAHDNDRPLTAEGRRKAADLVTALESTPVRGVYSSPYRRVIETVQPIAAAHGLAVQVLEDLRERRLADSPLAGRRGCRNSWRTDQHHQMDTGGGADRGRRARHADACHGPAATAR